MSPLCKIIWLRRTASSIFKNAFRFVSIKEFIWYKLFNDFQVDHSIASATGLFNIQKLLWNKASLKRSGINEDQLSEIFPTNFIRKDMISSSASLLNLPADTPFCIGASDGCLANIGSYAIEPGIAALTIGTSGAVRIANASPVFNFKAMTFNYVLDEKTFICGGPVNNGGNVVQWLFKALLNIQAPGVKDYEELFKAVETVPCGCNGLLFLPYLNGERAPLWDEKSCGCFFGIRSHHTNAHFLRAALEGVCYALKSVLQALEKSTIVLKQLNVSGGFIHSKTWMQILSDITGKKICLVQTEDASAIGAAVLGMKAINLLNDYSLQNLKDSVIIDPCLENFDLHKTYYKTFKNLYEPLKKSMHQLHDINYIHPVEMN
jgi:gluconokinase